MLYNFERIFFILSFFVLYILSFSLVRLRTFQLSAWVGTGLSNICVWVFISDPFRGHNSTGDKPHEDLSQECVDTQSTALGNQKWV